jgi:hypothetical protein
MIKMDILLVANTLVANTLANIYIHRAIFFSFYNKLFATKFCNFTNLKMLFPAMVMVSFLSRLKLCQYIAGIIHLPINIARLIATLQYSGELNIRFDCKAVQISFLLFLLQKMHKIVTSSNRLY